MSRAKKIGILHSPSAQDVLHCLLDCTHWLNHLLLKERSYTEFLQKLQHLSFYKQIDDRITIKRISADTGYTTSKVTKWLFEMYSDIFALNSERPDLFRTEGVRHELYLKNFDSTAYFTMWLKTTPRIGEHFSCFFFEAKLGGRMYWVEDVYHEIEEG